MKAGVVHRRVRCRDRATKAGVACRLQVSRFTIDNDLDKLNRSARA